jgi:hypothetical protein
MDWGRLFKTGAVAGVIYGILQGIVATFSYVFYREQIIEIIRSAIPSNAQIPMTMEQLADMGMMFAIPGSIFGGIIAGIIVAFIFSVLYEELMGRDSKKKGIFLAFLLLICIGLGELAYAGVLSAMFMVQTKFIMLAPLSAIFFLALGYLTGMFYDKFEDKHKHRG